MTVNKVGRRNLGHIGCRHFSTECFGLNILATENARGGCSGHNHKVWVGDGSMHVNENFRLFCGQLDALALLPLEEVSNVPDVKAECIFRTKILAR